jgi:hypothetical protein
MTERWFSDEELKQMSRPTMDRAIEALDRGDVQTARTLCEEMKHEWRYLHDMMVEGIGGLISFTQDRLGDDGVSDAWTDGQGRGWRRDVEKIANREAADRRGARATWRATRAAAPVSIRGRSITEDEVSSRCDEPMRAAACADGPLRGAVRS